MPDMVGVIDRLPNWVIVVCGIILITIIGYVDYLTGDYSLLIFYLFPIALVSWFDGCWRGAMMAVLSGVARFLADRAVVSNVRLLYWNSVEDTIFLMFVAFLIFLLKKALKPHQGG